VEGEEDDRERLTPFTKASIDRDPERDREPDPDHRRDPTTATSS